MSATSKGCVALFIALAAAACTSDAPLDPIPVVDGYDLVVTVMPAMATKGTDQTTGLGISDPASMTVRFKVTNRGNQPAPAHRAVIWVGEGPTPLNPGYFVSSTGVAAAYSSFGDTVTVPVLAPRDSAVGIATVRSTQRFLIAQTITRDSVTAHARLLLPDTLDVQHANDTASSTPFYVAIPIIWVDIDRLAIAKLRMYEPFPVTLTFHNYARHATATGASARMCVYDIDIGCEPFTWALFGRHDFADVAPRDSSVVRFNPAIVAGTTLLFAARMDIVVCITHVSWSDPYLADYIDHGNLQAQVCTDGAGSVTIRPDYPAACSPPLLEPGQTITLPAPNCDIRPPTTQPLSVFQQRVMDDKLVRDAFYMFAFRGLEGRRYRITQGFRQILDADGEVAGFAATGVANEIRVTRTGTYYINADKRATITLVDAGT